MVTVTGKGLPYETQDQRSKKWTTMVNVIYEEIGRVNSASDLAISSELLDELLGEETGLPQVRSHTQPVREAVAKKIKIGDTLPLHISRGLFSLPDIRAQLEVAPRMIRNRPTFFLTWFSKTIEDDVDERLSNKALAKIRPDLFNIATVENAQMRKPEEGASAADITDGVGTKKRRALVPTK